MIYFSTINDNRFMFLERFQELERQKQLTIRLRDDLLTGSRTSASYGHAAVNAEKGVDDGDDLSDLF